MGSLTVHVLGNGGKPVKGKKVFCEFPGAHFFGTHSTEYTGSDGEARFEDVPVGTVNVIVDGRTQVSVGVGQNDYKDVTVHL